jgi:hypothetical protein
MVRPLFILVTSQFFLEKYYLGDSLAQKNMLQNINNELIFYFFTPQSKILEKLFLWSGNPQSKYIKS